MATTLGSGIAKRGERVIEARWDDELNVLTVEVRGSGQPWLVVDTRKFSEVKKHRAMAHGVEQKVRDAGALPGDRKDGKPATLLDKYNAMKRVADLLNEPGDAWNLTRESGPRIGLDETWLSLAMQEVFPNRTADEIRAVVVGLDKAGRFELSQEERIKPVYDRIVAEARKGNDGAEKAKAAIAGW